MADIFVAALILAVVVIAVRHIRKVKKNGSKCMGCPSAGCCSGHCNDK